MILTFMLIFLGCKPEVKSGGNDGNDDPQVRRFQNVNAKKWTAAEQRIGQKICLALEYRRQKYEFEIDGLKTFEFNRKVKECGGEPETCLQ